ncbi:MAG TPA: glycosyltransferase, partial [Gaiellaceae bacterium]|nr:glycosyltransferase [Gaiellaceae bacterium]
MGLRICLVTPFSWSQPHDVNEHVTGAAAELRRLGHEVTVLAPSGRASDLVAGRRALEDGANGEVIAVGPAVPISRRSRIGLPVGVRANLSLALSRGGYDVVHGFEPGLPSLSYVALRDSHALSVASFFSPERLSYPPSKAQRGRLLSRIDALLAVSSETAAAAATRFPGDYRLTPLGIDTELFHPIEKRDVIVCEWRPGERLLTKALYSIMKELPGWELMLLRTKALAGRPSVPSALRGRVRVRTARSGQARAPILNEAPIFVPALAGLRRVTVEASAAGAAIASPPGVHEQPALAAAAVARLAESPELRGDVAAEGRRGAESQSFAELGRELDELYRSLAGRRRRSRDSDPLADRPWITVDLHMHTSWSHDCLVEPEELVEHAVAEGLGAIAVTDHNTFGGAQATAQAARGTDL